MAQVTYEKEITALLVVDPYNDFISEGGKIWDRLKAVIEANKCVPNMLQVLNAAREAGFAFSMRCIIARRQYPLLRQCHRDHKLGHGVDLFSQTLRTPTQ